MGGGIAVSENDRDLPSRFASRDDELAEVDFAPDLSMSANTKVAMTLSNSIIGVSILAMPFCMKQCGIILGTLMLVISSMLTRFTCHLLLKSAVISRRKSFEFVAYHSFGSLGKLAAEINIIGFMLGILISFFVVIGDLGPEIISKTFSVENTGTLRTCVLLILGFTVALPLSMLKEVDTLAQISALSILFYVVLALKTIAEAIPVIGSSDWTDKIELWNPSGILQSLPIFALALSCQTQIFEVYEALPNPSIKQMNLVVKMAVYLCTTVYLTVGIFGYFSNFNKEFTGNILLSFTPGFSTDVIKFMFVLSVAMGFPLIVLPCRTSVNSLLLKKSGNPFDVSGSFIPETRFKMITFAIVISTLGLGILCPNIEMVLGFLGSTIGVLTCIIFPALMFTRLTPKHTFEKWGSQFVFILGLILLASCTWINITGSGGKPVAALAPKFDDPKIDSAAFSNDKVFDAVPVGHARILDETISTSARSKVKILASNGGTKAYPKPTLLPAKPNLDEMVKVLKMEEHKVDLAPKLDELNDEQKRQEPPVPQEPQELVAGDEIKNEAVKVDDKKDNEINAEAFKKEDAELEIKGKADEAVAIEKAAKQLSDHEDAALEKQELILRQLEESQKVQKKLLEEQKLILKELKEHEKSHDHDKEQVEKDKVADNRFAKEVVKADGAEETVAAAGKVEPAKSAGGGAAAAAKKPTVVTLAAPKMENVGVDEVKGGGDAAVADVIPHRVPGSSLEKEAPPKSVTEKIESPQKKKIVSVGAAKNAAGRDGVENDIAKKTEPLVALSSNGTGRNKIDAVADVPVVAGDNKLAAVIPEVTVGFSKKNLTIDNKINGNVAVGHQSVVRTPPPVVLEDVTKVTISPPPPPPPPLPVLRVAGASNVDAAIKARIVPVVVATEQRISDHREPSLRK